MSRLFLGIASCGVVWLSFGCGATKRGSRPGEAEAGAPSETLAEMASEKHAGCETSVFVAESGIETCGAGKKTYRHRAKVGTGCTYDPALIDTCKRARGAFRFRWAATLGYGPASPPHLASSDSR